MGKRHYIFLVIGVLLIAFGIYTLVLSLKGPGDIDVATGGLTVLEKPQDDRFGVTADGPILIRKVEMYQYIKEGDKAVKAFSDKKERDFETKHDAYTNPKFPVNPKSDIFYGKVTIGDSGLLLAEDVLKPFTFLQYNHFEKQPTRTVVSGLADGTPALGLFPVDDSTYGPKHAPEWVIGDVRVTWYTVEPEALAAEYTAVGHIADGIIGDAEHIAELREGRLSRAEVAADFSTGNLWTGIGLIAAGLVFGVLALWPKFTYR